jgi:hypothetical protein
MQRMKDVGVVILKGHLFSRVGDVTVFWAVRDAR